MSDMRGMRGKSREAQVSERDPTSVVIGCNEMLFVLISVYMQFGVGLAPENTKYSPVVPGEHPKVSVVADYLIGLVLRRSHVA